MARGDIKWFADALLKMGQEVHQLSADQIALGIVTNVPVPSMNTPVPTWGANGTTDLSANQVALGTGYAGPIPLASVTWALAANVPNLSANSVVIPQDLASGFANASYGVFFNDTAANKPCIGFLDLGGPVGNQNGPVNINFNSSAVAGPVFRITPQ